MSYAGQEIASDLVGKMLKKDLKKKLTTTEKTTEIEEMAFRNEKSSGEQKKSKKKGNLDIII